MGSTKSKTDAPACTEPEVSEVMPVKVADKVPMPSKVSAKQLAPTAQPMTLPTKSWRALLQEQPLSADAKPFTPAKPKAAQSPPRAAVAETVVADPDEPEWMQYLSKKLNNGAGTPPKPQHVSPPAFSGSTGGKGGQRRQAAGGKGGAPAGDFSARRSRELQESSPLPPGGGGPAVIHTESYLKLLKEGTAKKKAPNFSTTKRKTPPGLGKIGSDADGLNLESDCQGNDLPMMSSSLVKKWSSAIAKKPVAQDAIPAEEAVVQSTTQDDIGISKFLLDQDLSEPAYYSDSEEVGAASSASAHRLGRRPKPSNAAIRTYVMQDLSFSLDEAVGMMLLRLQRFTDQQRIFFTNPADEKGPHQQRRFVIGLKEVARRTKQSKVACLIVAPDIEEDANSGGLDDRMRELLASAYQNHTPVIFALSRARLGKALGKSLHISVLGVLDATGAQDLLKQSVQLAGDNQQTWLARLGK